MFTRIVILTIAAAAMAACTTANNRAVKSNAAYQEVVDKNPDMTAEEADTAREFVMKEEDGSRATRVAVAFRPRPRHDAAPHLRR